MRMRASSSITITIALIGSAIACNFDPQSGGGDDDVPEAGTSCLGTGDNFTICIPRLPTTTFVVDSDLALDTTGPACSFQVTPPTGIRLCVKTATSITIAAKLTVTGPDPFVLLATDALTITPTGTVDVASRRKLPPGAGANAQACNASTAGTADPEGGAGGGGGSFRTVGGNGGTGNAGAAAAGAAGSIALTPDFLRGGCGAGDGGNGGVVAAGIISTGGRGGAGGGAVYLLAGGPMEISGTINASGAGGEQGLPGKSGAGGGGSGGMIVLHSDSQMLVNGALIFTNGGGGGEGGDTNNDGDPGDDPLSPTAPPEGGSGGNGGAGAIGGDGAFLATDAGVGASDNDGGGGGGGGTGYLRVLSGQPLTQATVSPTPTP